MVQDLPISAEQMANCVARFRDRRPHVHCITNGVAQAFTANVLLAAGGTPSMTIVPTEIEAFVDFADALLINLGTLDADRSRSMALAAARANDEGKPWLLDPVFVQASRPRLREAFGLLEFRPTAIRCNQSELDAFDDRGRLDCAVAVTGKTDVISDRARQISLDNGSPLMDRVTAMGCALGGVMAGFLAVEGDRLLALSSAATLFSLAGERAALLASGPGSFVPLFIDALAMVDETTIVTGANIL